MASPLAGARLVYYAPRDILIPRVARQCIMRFCEGLSRTGVDVELVSLGVRLQHDEPTRTRSVWDVYGIEHPFPLRVLPALSSQDSPDWIKSLQRAASYRLHALWHHSVRRELHRRDLTVFYFRNFRSMRPLLALRRRHPRRVLTVLEIHGPVPERHRAVLEQVDGIVSISRTLADETIAAYGLDPGRIEVAHTGVSLERVERVRVPKAEARRRLGLPADRPIVAYTGKVHRGYREAEMLVEAAAGLSPETLMVIVGGRADQLDHFRRLAAERGADNVRLTGFVAPADVHLHQSAADALVLYYPSDIEYNDHRSPAKLFEYMAAGRAIVAADYRSLHEVLDETCAVFVEPDSPAALAAALRAVLEDRATAERMGAEALRRASSYTWERRAERVAAFIERLREER